MIKNKINKLNKKKSIKYLLMKRIYKKFKVKIDQILSEMKYKKERNFIK